MFNQFAGEPNYPPHTPSDTHPTNALYQQFPLPQTTTSDHQLKIPSKHASEYVNNASLHAPRHSPPLSDLDINQASQSHQQPTTLSDNNTRPILPQSSMITPTPDTTALYNSFQWNIPSNSPLKPTYINGVIPQTFLHSFVNIRSILTSLLLLSIVIFSLMYQYSHHIIDPSRHEYHDDRSILKHSRFSPLRQHESDITPFEPPNYNKIYTPIELSAMLATLNNHIKYPPQYVTLFGQIFDISKVRHLFPLTLRDAQFDPNSIDMTRFFALSGINPVEYIQSTTQFSSFSNTHDTPIRGIVDLPPHAIFLAEQWLLHFRLHYKFIGVLNDNYHFRLSTTTQINPFYEYIYQNPTAIYLYTEYVSPLWFKIGEYFPFKNNFPFFYLSSFITHYITKPLTATLNTPSLRTSRVIPTTNLLRIKDLLSMMHNTEYSMIFDIRTAPKCEASYMEKSGSVFWCKQHLYRNAIALYDQFDDKHADFGDKMQSKMTSIKHEDGLHQEPVSVGTIHTQRSATTQNLNAQSGFSESHEKPFQQSTNHKTKNIPTDPLEGVNTAQTTSPINLPIFYPRRIHSISITKQDIISYIDDYAILISTQPSSSPQISPQLSAINDEQNKAILSSYIAKELRGNLLWDESCVCLTTKQMKYIRETINDPQFLKSFVYNILNNVLPLYYSPDISTGGQSPLPISTLTGKPIGVKSSNIVTYEGVADMSLFSPPVHHHLSTFSAAIISSHKSSNNSDENFNQNRPNENSRQPLPLNRNIQHTSPIIAKLPAFYSLNSRIATNSTVVTNKLDFAASNNPTLSSSLKIPPQLRNQQYQLYGGTKYIKTTLSIDNFHSGNIFDNHISSCDFSEMHELSPFTNLLNKTISDTTIISQLADNDVLMEKPMKKYSHYYSTSVDTLQLPSDTRVSPPTVLQAYLDAYYNDNYDYISENDRVDNHLLFSSHSLKNIVPVRRTTYHKPSLFTPHLLSLHQRMRTLDNNLPLSHSTTRPLRPLVSSPRSDLDLTRQLDSFSTLYYPTEWQTTFLSNQSNNTQFHSSSHKNLSDWSKFNIDGNLFLQYGYKVNPSSTIHILETTDNLNLNVSNFSTSPQSPQIQEPTQYRQTLQSDLINKFVSSDNPDDIQLFEIEVYPRCDPYSMVCSVGPGRPHI